MGFDQTGEADLCANGQFGGSEFTVLALSLGDDPVSFDLKETVFVIEPVVSKHIQGCGAGVEAGSADGGGFLLVGLAGFILEITAAHVFVHAFVCFHCFTSLCKLVS